MAVPPWTHLFSEVFDFQRTLTAADLRYYVGRESAPSAEIVRRLREEPGRPLKFFLTGSPGSGKSSEIAQLGRLLQDDYAVIGLDVYRSAANVTQVSGGEILFMIGAAACRLAEGRWGQKISEKAQRALFEAFRGIAREPERLDFRRLLKGIAILTATAATVHGAPAALAAGVTGGLAEVAGARLPGSIALRPFGGLAREHREGDMEIDRLAAALQDVLAEVAEVRPPLVLLDGLDRIEDQEAIRQLFLQTRVLGLPSCPVVYNGPIALWFGPDAMVLETTAGFELCPLPNIPVELPVGAAAKVLLKDVEAGRSVLRAVIARRLEAAGLGTADVIEPDALELLVSSSGGVLRDLVRLVHQACRLAHRAEPRPERIDLAMAEQAFREVAAGLQPFAANELRVEELRKTEETGRPSGTEESLRLLLRGAILVYKNGVPWFRVHPYLRPLL